MERPLALVLSFQGPCPSLYNPAPEGWETESCASKKPDPFPLTLAFCWDWKEGAHLK